jgi:hypothetical protein
MRMWAMTVFLEVGFRFVRERGVGDAWEDTIVDMKCSKSVERGPRSLV